LGGREPAAQAAYHHALYARKIGNWTWPLKGSNQTGARALGGRQACEIPAVKMNPARRRSINARQDIDERTLSGSIRPNQPNDSVVFDRKGDVNKGTDCSK
jgi:hypothetical protein